MPQGPAPEIIRLTTEQLENLLAELRGLLPPKTYELVEGLLRTLQWLFLLLEEKTAKLARIRQLIGGPQTEKTCQLFAEAGEESSAATVKPKGKRKGHGRNGAKDYPGAQRIKVPHPSLKAGDPCPKCERGKVYLWKIPALIVRIVAQPLIAATIYELEKLRCALCGAVFTAPAPPAAGLTKYDPSVGVVLGLQRYGAGQPMYRTAKWQRFYGVPIPESTQWELIVEATQLPAVIYPVMMVVAAQAHLFHNDDTSMRVQSLHKEIAATIEEEEQDPEATSHRRTGIFTTGILAQVGPVRIALFFTGQRHAGENLAEVLKNRVTELAKPLQMCDGLSRNEPKEFETILSNCLAHARRKFVEQIENFPQECRKVLESLREVYRQDELCRQQKLSDPERLAWHQKNSQPVMDELKSWMTEQLENKQVEPNSQLGKAYRYMLKRWAKLTRFLEVPGAPLDNNCLEQALKMAITHRKNSLSYKTLNGARVGDIQMSIIHTCVLNKVNPYDYAMALQRNAEAVLEKPEDWLPWVYQRTLEAKPKTGDSLPVNTSC